MLKSKLASVAAAVALSFGAIGSASAITITAGDYWIEIGNYDLGTLGYGNAPGLVCGTVSDCNSAASNPALGGFGYDTMGIFNITSIKNITSGQTTYLEGQGGKYLTGVFGKLSDQRVTVSCDVDGVCSTKTYSTGGEWAIYENGSAWDPSQGGAAGDWGNLTYPGITGGSIWLSGVFGSGASSVQPGATYVSNYDNGTISGSGMAYLDVTGGTAKTQFDTNKLTGNDGLKHDMYMDIVYNDVNGAASGIGWTVTSAGQIKGNAVPEPGTMALAGLALLGAGLASRRRKS